MYDEVVHIPKFEWTPNTVFFSVAEAETEAIDAYMRLHSRRTVVERRVWCVSGTHVLQISQGGGEKLKIIGGKLMEGKDRDYVQS